MSSDPKQSLVLNENLTVTPIESSTDEDEKNANISITTQMIEVLDLLKDSSVVEEKDKHLGKVEEKNDNETSSFVLDSSTDEDDIEDSNHWCDDPELLIILSRSHQYSPCPPPLPEHFRYTAPF